MNIRSGLPEYPLILEKPDQGFYKTVSDDLKSILPDLKSFIEFHGDITK